MYTVIREMHFSYGHRLLGYEGKCRHLHGHNGRLEVHISTPELNDKGMVMDFDEVKRRIQNWVDTELDHRMLLSKLDPAVKALKALNEPVVEVDFNPTAENIARMILEYARGQGIPVVEVRLWETSVSSAVYSVDRRE